MRSNTHPFHRTVMSHDTNANEFFEVGPTIETEREIEFGGKMYLYVTLDISSKSRPYYTGKQRTFDNEGNATRF